jgi:DMSO reductase anchor subunit
VNPAYSVIFFTTASGAGYGLLIGLSIFGPMGLAPTNREFGLIGFGLALSLVSTGLLSSTFHLGHPERAWRAVSQWRSSWLSREGVLALATYAPAVALAIGWVLWERATGLFALAALLTNLGALATVWCTGMIYGSLRTIPAWNQSLVAPLYVLLGLATGMVLLQGLARVMGGAQGLFAWIALGLLAASYAAKRAYWRSIDGAERHHTVGAATGLGRFGAVRPLDPPHTQPNFVMREMGYRVARKHALKLRRAVDGALFAVPALGMLASIGLDSALGTAASGLAIASAAIGVAVERWLFFAEARHVVMLYYGAERV